MCVCNTTLRAHRASYWKTAVNSEVSNFGLAGRSLGLTKHAGGPHQVERARASRIIRAALPDGIPRGIKVTVT